MQALKTLKNLKQWVCWRSVIRGGKARKLPVNPHTGKSASVDNPDTWSDYNTAVKAHKRYGTTGLGFVFTKASGIIGVDLDHVITESGEVDSYAIDIIKTLDSYTEISPSGRGVHVLLKGKIPRSLKTKMVEIYDDKRYFTVTGKQLPDTCDEIAERRKELMTVYNQYTKSKRTIPVADDTKLFNDIQNALEFIPKISDYDQWLRILMAVHSEFPDLRGVQLIEQWSPGYPGEVAGKFASFKDAGVNIGTLFYIAKINGFTPDPLDAVYPPLTTGQRQQVTKIVHKLAEDLAWEKYHDNLTSQHLEQLGIDKIQADHFQFGYCQNWRELNDLFTIPYWNQAGDAVNIEYMTNIGDIVGYELKYPQLYYTVPFTQDHENPDSAFIFDSSMMAVSGYRGHGNIEIAGSNVGFWGLPKLDLNQDSLVELDSIDRIYIITDTDSDLTKYECLKSRARFLVMPINVQEALDELSTREIKRMLVTAQTYEMVTD